MRWLVLLLLVSPAFAEPPPGADPALAPFFKSLRQPDSNISCCDISDCRPVKTRHVNGRLQVFIGPQFPYSPNDWRDVPDDAVIRGVANQVGELIACYFSREVRCFLDGGSS